MSVEENRAIIRRGVEEGWNKRNLDVFMRLPPAMLSITVTRPTAWKPLNSIFWLA